MTIILCLMDVWWEAGMMSRSEYGQTRIDFSLLRVSAEIII